MSRLHWSDHYPSNIVTLASSSPTVGAADDLPAPPVVAVIVAHNPGDWFASTLGSFAAQTYEHLSVLVVDANSDDPVEGRVAAVLPDAVCRRLDHSPGFGPACNEALEGVEGAAFLLFCHDDVVLAPDAVAQLVAEAYRSNAGVVGPKVVQWDDPRRLLAMGMGADRFGHPAPLVERGEMDQGQHDAIHEAFFVPGGATLVRADLFGALGGFDPDIDLHGEDLDLCWRARTLGAAVAVAPAARVGHLEALALRRDDDRRRRQQRHRLRTMRVATSAHNRLWLVPLAFVQSVVEALGALVLWRPRHVADVAGAWAWNATHGASLRRRRHQLASVRTVRDHDVRAAQVTGSARLRAWLRARRTRSGDSVDGRPPLSRSALIAWTLTAAILVLGGRTLVTSGVPAVGDFAAFPSRAGDLLGAWWSGYRPVGLGSGGVTPPLLGLLWGASFLSFGFTEVARTVLIVGMLPLGAFGVWRLATPLGPSRVRSVALLVAVANPVPYDAIANGRWSALVLYGLTPWIVLHLARAARLEPFDVSASRSTYHVVAAGVLTALATLWLPLAPVVVVLLGAALALGGMIATTVRGSGRVLVAAASAAGCAAVLCAPWLIGLILGGEASTLLGASAGGGDLPGLADLARFRTGPVGGSWLGFALVVTALPALLFGREWRLVWAIRSWVVVAGCWALVAVTGRGLLGPFALVPEVVLAPAVVMLAVAAGAGIASVARDLPAYRAGWRQLVSGAALVAVVVALLPVLGSAVDGRWEAPERDLSDKLAFIADEGTSAPFRVLWVSETDLLPLAGWPLDVPQLGAASSGIGAAVSGPRLAMATSWSGMPAPADLFTTPQASGTAQLADAVQAALAGETDRLGELVGPMGIRYVVVPSRLAPGAATLTPESDDEEIVRGTPRPSSAGSAATGVVGVVDALARQLDLVSIPVGGEVAVWSNAAWVPARSLHATDTLDGLATGPADDIDPDRLAAAPAPGLAGGTAVLPGPPTGATGSLPSGGDMYVASQADAGWQLTSAGGDAARTDVLGWAMRFDDVAAGEATLAWSPPLLTRLLILAVPILWLVALWWLVRTRSIDGPPPRPAAETRVVSGRRWEDDEP